MAQWQSFYVLLGSSAAALIGLQFVVVALVANMRQLATPSTIHAFGTPRAIGHHRAGIGEANYVPL